MAAACIVMLVRMTEDAGDNCDPRPAFAAAAANQVKPTSRMK